MFSDFNHAISRTEPCRSRREIFDGLAAQEIRVSDG